MTLLQHRRTYYIPFLKPGSYESPEYDNKYLNRARIRRKVDSRIYEDQRANLSLACDAWNQLFLNIQIPPLHFVAKRYFAFRFLISGNSEIDSIHFIR